ncbi:MAG: response regulator [Xenococcaceae cyanobacterium MO_207.B15]|nr:response regulator [Xenococcaceae cyanobacterium MO_207.B15]MDJ0742390.1 response regulator [Xenococcaceae cyanobacterium MO_167.B27]
MKKKRILFIDDEEDIRILASFCLELEAGWEMITASSGKEGIEIAASQQPDAILLDAMMPEMDGLETLVQLQNNPKTKHIPTIFITAKVQASDRRRFYAAGAKGVINKPFDSLTLASQISGFLGWSNQ